MSDEYARQKLQITEWVLKKFMDVFAETATPYQLKCLAKIGEVANEEIDKLEREKP